MNKHYQLRFLPMFQDDLNGIVDYIAGTLQNPIAARALVDAVEKAIAERLPFADSFEAVPLHTSHPYPYYVIPVRNYSIFYVLIEDTMEVRRILYSRRDWNQILQ